MSQKTDVQLTAEAQQIRNETQIGANTAVRVGDMLIDIIDSKVNNSGGGGGGNSVGLPTPIISIPSGNANSVLVHFTDTSFFDTATNPEIFLMRWRSKRKKKKHDINGVYTAKLGARFVHPCTDDAHVKWAGWKFFGGTQRYHYNGGPSTNLYGRVTEWALAPVLPFQKTSIPFNRFMFFVEFNVQAGAVNQYDVNIFANGDYGFKDNKNATNSDLRATIGGTSRIAMANNPNYAKTQKYCFVLAVDNPAATQTNGLCPKIFSGYSAPFYAVARNNEVHGVPNDVQLINVETSYETKIKKTNRI